MSHSLTVKVYYEDTDAGGVVYYANYLRYLERARTEFLAGEGLDIPAFHAEGRFFVVTRVDIRYRRPARLGDILTVTTEVSGLGKASVNLKNRVLRGEELLAEADVALAFLGPEGRPERLPGVFAEIAERLGLS